LNGIGVLQRFTAQTLQRFNASTFQRFNVSTLQRFHAYTGVSRFRPTRRRLRNMAFPLLLELRFRNPCCRLRRIFDG
jgi:hypothetical protein